MKEKIYGCLGVAGTYEAPTGLCHAQLEYSACGTHLEYGESGLPC